MNVWKCVAQQKHTGHNALVNDYRRRNSLQAALSSHHIRKCYINKMEGPCGPLPTQPPLPPPAPLRDHRALSGALCFMAASHSLFHTAVYIRQPYSPSSSHPPLPLLCPRACSLFLLLYSCLGNSSSVSFF